MVFRSVLILSALIAFGACEAEDIAPQDQCGAVGLVDLVGQPASVLEVMKFAGPVRFIRPKTAVTMDYIPTRLNILIDADERIGRIYCG